MLIEYFTYKAKNGREYSRAKLQCDNCGLVMERIPAAAVRPMFHVCSKACMIALNTKDGVMRKRIEQTCLQKFGALTPAENSSVKQKIIETNVECYGVEWPNESSIIRNKFVQTSLNKYGVDNPAKTLNTKLKIKKTTLENHGVEWPCLIPKTQKNSHSISSIEKMFETRKLNGSMKKSSHEDRVFEACSERAETTRWVNVNGWSIDLQVVTKNSYKFYIQVDGVFWHGLDRPIQEIRLMNDDLSKKICEKYVRDQEQVNWFFENDLKLIRITDVDINLCVNSDEIWDLVLNRLDTVVEPKAPSE